MKAINVLKTIFSVLLICLMFSLSLNQSSLKVYADDGDYITSYSFTATDVRGNDYSFSGSDGNISVIMFGGLSSCGNCKSVLNSLNQIYNVIGNNGINYYAFDIKGNSTEDLLQQISTNNINSNIHVSSIEGDAYNLFGESKGYASISGTWYMPLIIYKNANGVAYHSSTGYVTLEEIVSSINNSGNIVVTMPSEDEPYYDDETLDEETTDDDINDIDENQGEEDKENEEVISVSKTKIKSLKAGKKYISVKWNRKSATGYIIQYSTSSKFTKGNTHTITIKKTSITSKKITKLKSKKKYYIRLQCYKTIDGLEYKSSWSAKKSIKTK